MAGSSEVWRVGFLPRLALKGELASLDGVALSALSIGFSSSFLSYWGSGCFWSACFLALLLGRRGETGLCERSETAEGCWREMLRVLLFGYSLIGLKLVFSELSTSASLERSCYSLTFFLLTFSFLSSGIFTNTVLSFYESWFFCACSMREFFNFSAFCSAEFLIESSLMVGPSFLK